ncbi:hypothetical protein [Streptomyces sp. NPDC006446]|uniref:hypothetical protein n=1 Tax=Streptomyces sp. NPDC006446 TaxID=3154301 RepID=UPI0033B5598D
MRWTYHSERPVATQLSRPAIGRFTLVDRTACRSVTWSRTTWSPRRGSTGDSPPSTPWLEERLGPYSLDRYGLLVGDTDLGGALETQTVSPIPEADLLGDRVGAERDPVHEPNLVAGPDLDVLRPWLFGAKTPPMPNHPGWVVDPVQG